MNIGKLSIKLLEGAIVLNSAFIQLLLDTCLSNSLVGDIVELGDKQIVDAILRIRTHDTIHGGSLLLERQEVLHEGSTYIFILDTSDQVLVLLTRFIDLLDLLVDAHTFVAALLLQLLDEVEHSLLVELELGTKDELWQRVLHSLEL